MTAVFTTVLPLFALILSGWIARRVGMLGSHATGELNRFVVYLALPALLFDIVANARWSDIWQPGFVATFGLGIALVFIATIALRLHRPRPFADAVIDGLNAAYANTGFIGFPLALAIWGRGALAPTLIANILTICILFAVAVMLIEMALQSERRPRQAAMKVARVLGGNPLLVAPVLGGLFLALGIAVPPPIEHFLKLLGGAASPCALVALGLFLAERQGGTERLSGGAGILVAIKLIVHPASTWLLARWVFHLSPASTQVAVLLAALPTGTGPFMAAKFYHREASLTSRVVLISTIFSLATITAYLSASA